ncbi:MAG: T9SS type A sorting domain-containing protein [Opitutaceae bacterium]|nr:T9SS type A sorting domain-containing protein [Cytophagales bacterium]
MFINFANGAGPHPEYNASGVIINGTVDNGAIWKFNTKSSIWTNVTPSGISRAWGGISVDPSNSNRVVASTINNYQQQGSEGYGDRIYLSTNGGTSWTDVIARGYTLDPNGCTWIAGHAIHWAGSIEFDPFDTKKVMVTSGNGIFSNINIDLASTPWKFDIIGLEETVPLDFISIPGGFNFSAIGDYDGFKHDDPTAYAPIHNPRTGTTTGISYAALNTNKLLRTGNEMYYSTDQGISWKSSTTKGAKGKVAISANGNTFLHCPEKSTTTYYSTNNGASWTPCNGLSIGGAFPVADPVNSNKFYAYGNGTMYVSTDGGLNFAASGNPGAGGSNRVQTAPGKEGHLWVALYYGGFTRSVNSGQSFSKINGVSTCSAVGLGKAAPGSTYFTIYIWGTVNNVTGVFRSTDEGANWTRINDDAHEYGGPGNGQFIIGDMDVYSRVYMSTAGRGVAYGESSSVTALESEENLLADSGSFSSINCFPNPFQKEITIKSEQDFTYSIYDLTGKVQETGHGYGSVLAGNQLTSGTYIVKVQSINGNKVQKVEKK